MADSTRNDAIVRSTLLGIFGNTVLALVKGVAGVCGHSHALIADAIESSSDVFSSILLLFGLRFAQKPPDANHPYGHGRAESLTTFVIVGFLLSSATIIVIESVHNMMAPQDLPSPFTLWVLAAVIIAKEMLYRFYHQRSQLHQSSALSAEAWHHRSDALTSFAAFIGISLALILGPDWAAADDWAALFAAGFIYVNAWRIFRPLLGEVMDEDTHEALRTDIIALAEATPEIHSVTGCLIRKMGSEYVVDLHVEMPSHLSVAEATIANNHLRSAIHARNQMITRVLIEVSDQA